MPASQQSPQELETLVEITEILTGRLPFVEKCESALAVLARFTGSGLVTLRSFDPETSTFDLVAVFNELVPPNAIEVIQTTSALSESALAMNRPIVINDYPAFEGLDAGYLNAGIKSSLVTPVEVDGQLVGTLGFGSTSLDHYQNDSVGILVAISSAVGMLMAKAELEEINQVEAEIGRIVSEPLVGQDVFERFAGEAARIIRFDRLALNSINLDDYTYVTEFLLGKSLPNYQTGVAQDITATGLELALKNRSGQLIQFDNPTDSHSPFRLAGPFLAAGQPYLISIPLVVGNQIVGTLGFNRGSRPFSQKDLTKAARLGSLVTGAFADFKQQEYRNQAEREISKNRIILEVEAAIGRILSAPFKSSDVFESIKSELAKLTPVDRLVIMSVDLETQTFSQEFNEFFNNPDMMVAPNSRQPYAGSITGEVIRTGVAQVINSDDARLTAGDMPLAQMVIQQGYQSMMAAPVEFEGTIIGAIVCARKVGQYGEEDLGAANRLGNLLAGALATFKIAAERDRAELARAESESRYRTILQAEANIGRILSSPLNRTGASDSLISEIASVISLGHVVIAGVDTETGTFSPDFVEFLSDPRLMVLDNHGNPYTGSITEDVIKHGTGQIIDFDNPRLAAGQLPYAKRVFDLGYRTMMAVPLAFEEKIIGTLILLSRRERAYGSDDLANADRIGNLLAGALATFKIATERDRALSDLSESESRFRQIADSILGVFWLIEFEPNKLVYASGNFEDLWGIPIERVYDDIARWSETIHADDKERLQELRAQAHQTGELEVEYRIIHPDGAVRWIWSQGFPVKDDSGKLLGMSGITEDITEKRSELERLNEAGRLLSIGELASGVAHEINNPLAAINLYSESLMGQALPDSVIQDLKVISAQSQRAAAIVRNLLQFARKSSPEISKVNAREFIDRCVELKIHDFRINNISATTDVLLEHPEISIDEQLMTQVIVNILSNAESACVEAHGRGRISISVCETENSTQISISDDGPGIPADNLLKVFNPFFTTKEVGGGTGLGLSVSYGIIAQLGGNLWVESDGASGSTFYIEVPLEDLPTDAGQALEHTGAIGSPGNGAGSPARVLVVDDEPDLRHVLVRLLQRKNHTVEEAADGEEAWAKLQEQSYDCILLDLRMAGTGGKELFQWIYSSDLTMAAKVIFVTGDLANTGTRSFLNSLTNRVLEKPISIGDLEEAIASVTRVGQN